MTDAVVLTGASGFVGSAVLAELVTQGRVVHAISRQPGQVLPGVFWHQADLLDPAGRAAVARLASHMIHCAWQIEHGVFWTAPANEVWRAATVDLVGRFMAGGGRRVVALGTCAEYDATGEGVWDEARQIAPATPYGQAKAALHADLTHLCGERLVWARLFNLYGPHEDPRRLIAGMICALAEGRVAEVRAAGLIRDFASTGHVARGLCALLHSGAGGAVDVGSGSRRSLGALAAIVARATGQDDLLRLSHNPGPNDPAVMAPELTRFAAITGLRPEVPEAALTRHVAQVLRHGLQAG